MQQFQQIPKAESESWPTSVHAVAVTDAAGGQRWTVAAPSDQTFPISRHQQESICTESEALRDEIIQGSRLMRAKQWRSRSHYYAFDNTFLEVDRAETIGALPVRDDIQSGPACDRSMTFVLEEDDASFGNILLLLWLSYGLATREGRAFFIDDSRWAYGQYSSFFAPPPSPGCSQPPPHQMVPCPRSAKHLLVSSATAPWTYGSAFEKEFAQARSQGSERSHRIFDLLRNGYEDLFVLTGEDALYAKSRLALFRQDARQNSGAVVGMHVRRGDLHPYASPFSQDYLPIERYASASRELLRNQLQAGPSGSRMAGNDLHKFSGYVNSPMLLGCDDPDIFDSAEFKEATSPFETRKAQERIQLATKATLDLASPAEPIRDPGSAYVKHVDENSGWEGGFYSSLFYALGREKNVAPNAGRGTAEPNESQVSEAARQLRVLVGRAYVLDLAIMGGSDGIVCAVSSATCRLLGVMMGWDAIVEGRWVNVDDAEHRPWSWR